MNKINYHFFFLPFFFFFLTIKNGFESKFTGYYTLSSFSLSSCYSGCIKPFFIAFKEVYIFPFANFYLISSISSRYYDLLFILLFYYKSCENGLFVFVESVFIRRLSKHDNPFYVFNGYLLSSHLTYDLPSLIA